METRPARHCKSVDLRILAVAPAAAGAALRPQLARREGLRV